MIRFLADSWLEALVRPIAMAVPSGGIYVETIAPDFRFVFVLLLFLVCLVARLRWREGAGRTLALLAFCALSFVPWMATTGNGRYFMAILFLVGPLCVALAHYLPATRSTRLASAALMLGLQGGLVFVVEPWNSWGLAPWREAPAFDVQVPPDVRSEPATYVALSGISYSLMAYRFHPESRWISLASLQGKNPESADGVRARRFLAAGPDSYVIFQSIPGQGRVEKRPPPDLMEALDLALLEFSMRTDPVRDCRMLWSRGLTSMGVHHGKGIPSLPAEQRGFWMCPLQKARAAEAPVRPLPSPEVEAVMDVFERQCPRFFPRGVRTAMMPAGARRFYPDSDMRLYVLDDGRVMYKYLRALNPVLVGAKEDVLSQGFRLDCTNIRGRAGLPWEREI